MGEVAQMKKRVKELEAELGKFKAHHPAARANRLVHLGLLAAGGTALVLAALGLTFGEGGSTALQIFVGILLVMPETLGKASATEAAKAFASSFGSTAGKVTRGKKNG